MTELGLESEHVEFKKSLSERDRAYRSLAAMLNKHCEGRVYFGVQDDGTVIGINIGKDTMRTLSREIGDKIQPQVVPEIDVLISDDGLTYISVTVRGFDRPYSKDGVFYIRAGEENRQIPIPELRMMFQKYSDMLKISEAFRQDLSFGELAEDLRQSGLHAEDDERLRRQFELLTANGCFNIQAELLSDQNNVPLVVTTYSGTDKTALSFRTEFTGHNLLREVRSVNDYVLNLNETQVDMSSTVRKNIKLFDAAAFQEAWINAAVHTTWMLGTPPSVHIFDDRIEVLSIGSTPYGQSEDDFFAGVSTPVNESLMRAFIAAGLCEHTGHGVPVITEKYGRGAFKITGGYVLVTIPFSNLRSAQAFRQRNRDQQLTENEDMIIGLMTLDPSITTEKISQMTEINISTVKATVTELKRKGMLEREGSRKKGKWVVLQH